MALVGEEHWSLGFVWANAAETQLAVTTSLTGAVQRNGFLRDPDGRLVIDRVGPAAYVTGFLRAASGALYVPTDRSTPDLYPFPAV